MTLTEAQRGTVGFDLEKARAGIAHYRIENPSNVDTESHLKELVDQANLAEDALAEIERLRPFEIAARDLDSDLTKIAGERDDRAARIKELESSLDEAETLTKKNAELMNAYLARIAELEDAPVEERAGAIRCEFYDHCEIDLPDAMIRARQELQADGKIGPGARPPCWQITDERKDALKDAISILEEAEELVFENSINVLRAMLREAE